MTKPMTQIIRELVSANFPIEILGRSGTVSQFGMPYVSFVNGVVDPNAALHEAHDGQINGWAIEWISQQPREHDVAVWLAFPHEEPVGTGRLLRWRLHTMSRADLIKHLQETTRG